jgi:hypothetical protein
MTPTGAKVAPAAERIRRVERMGGGKGPEPELSAKAQWAADNARTIVEWLDELGCLPGSPSVVNSPQAAVGPEVETKSLPTHQRR